MRPVAIAFGLAALFLVPGAHAAADAPAAARHLPAPEHVSKETRAEIKARMARHGETMSSLVRSVVLLDRRTTRVLAGRIADEEVIARVGSGRDQKPPPLPTDFFAAQEELSASARQLAAAAIEGGDDKILADRFAALTRTCVSCHAAYLHGRSDPQPMVAPKANDAPAPK